MSDFDTFRRRVQGELFAGLPAHISRLSWDAGQIAAVQRSRLRMLLAHAIARSPFHARRLAGVEPATFELAALRTLPVMTKADLMDEWDQVVTDPRLTLRAAEESLAVTGAEPGLLLGEYACLATGGSSGRRGVFVSDASALTEFLSLLLRPSAAPAGGALSGGLTIAFVAAASAVHATGLAPQIMAGSPVTFIPVPVTLPLAEIVARLNGLQPPFLLYGYASILARLAREQSAGRLRIAPTAVTSTSETLLPACAAAISSAFRAPVTNTFASTEGLVGSSEPGDPAVTFACDGCIAELVDERNRPVPPGTPSAKVLITNLYNHVQPLIRYEIGDCCTRQPDSPEHGHLRAAVEGRSDEILRYETADVHPLVLRSVLLASPEVTDYQVRQTPCGVAVAVQSDRLADPDALRRRLRSALARAGLRDPDVSIQSVPALPLNPETGKLRRFIPA
jgi:phenylacetate-CoA ligase